MCVRFRIGQFKVAPQEDGLQELGQPSAAAGKRMYGAESVNTGWPARIKGYEGLADRVLL